MRSLPSDMLPKGMDPPALGENQSSERVTLRDMNYVELILRALDGLLVSVTVEGLEVREREGEPARVTLQLAVYRKEG